MTETIPNQAYLVRLWPTMRGGVRDSRISLESVATGERKDFADLDSLLAFLRARAEEDEQVPGSPRR